MFSAYKNSNWDQLQQVSRIQKLDKPTLTSGNKPFLLLISVSEIGNLIRSIMREKCPVFGKC